jgi:hypothetical protein
MPLRTFQKAVATAGTAEQVSADSAKRLYLFRAHPGNTGNNVYIGDDGTGDVASTNGFALGKGDVSALQLLCKLSEMWVDVDTSGDKLCVLQVIE